MANSLPRFDNTLGALFLGHVGTSILYGITSVQVYIYYKEYTRDKTFLKALIGMLWILDSIHFAFITYGQYFYCVSNFGNPVALETPIWTIASQAMVTCFSEVTIRAIFMHRIWTLRSGSIPLLVAIAILSLSHFITAFYSDIQLLRINTLDLPHYLRITTITAFASGVAVDALIAGTLLNSLWKAKTGFRRTDRVVGTLMVYAINTCLLTCLWGLMCLVTYIVWPNTAIYIGMLFMIPEFSLNALLATLNARRRLRDLSLGVTSSGSTPYELQSTDRGLLPVIKPTNIGHRATSDIGAMIINVEKHVDIQKDGRITDHGLSHGVREN